MKHFLITLMIMLVGCATSPQISQPVIINGETTIAAIASDLTVTERATLELELEEKIHALSDIPMIRKKILKKKAQIDALVAAQEPDNSPPGSFKPINIPKRKQAMISLVLRGLGLAEAEYAQRVAEIKILLGQSR